MSKNEYWLKSGFFTLLERGAVLIFGFGGLLLLLRQISLAQFGTWAVFLSIVSIVEVGRMGLLGNALVKYLSNKIGTPEEGTLNSASLVLNGLVTLIIVGLLYGTAPTVGRMTVQDIWVDPVRFVDLLQSRELCRRLHRNRRVVHSTKEGWLIRKGGS